MISRTHESETELLDRQPPCCLDMEENLVGSLIIDPSLIDEVSQVLPADAFYDLGLKDTYQAILKLIRTGKPFDQSLLLQELKKNESIDKPSVLLVKATKSVPHALHAKYYADQILEKYRLRQAREIGIDLIKHSEGLSLDSGLLIDLGIKRLSETLEQGITTEIQLIGNEVSSLVETLYLGNDQKQVKVETGIETLDEHLNGGFNPSQFIVLAARPSIGKSMLALAFALHASKLAIPVSFFSLEMSRTEIAERCLSNQSGISKAGFEAAVQLRGSEVNEAVRKISDRPLYVDDTASITVDSLVSRIRMLKHKYGIKLAVIDYLQLIEPADSRQSRQQQIGQISRRLKQAAQSLDISILALSQLNREAEGQRPLLKHLREAGDIEQDANVVLFLWQEKTESEFSKLTIGKNRSGQRGIDIDLKFYKAECRFADQADQVFEMNLSKGLEEFSDWNGRPN